MRIGGGHFVDGRQRRLLQQTLAALAEGGGLFVGGRTGQLQQEQGVGLERQVRVDRRRRRRQRGAQVAQRTLRRGRQQRSLAAQAFAFVVAPVQRIAALAAKLQVAVAAVLAQQIPRADRNASLATVADPSTAVVAVRVVTETQGLKKKTFPFRYSAYVDSDGNEANRRSLDLLLSFG